MRLKVLSAVLLCLMAASLLLVSVWNARPKQPRQQPAPIVTPISAPWQPSTVIAACLDTPPLMPEGFFRKAAAALAGGIEKAVTVNSGGIVVYISRISSRSFEDDALTFRIPPIPADPGAPTPPQSNGAYVDAAAVRAYQNAVTEWQKRVVANHRYLGEVQHMVRQKISRLLTLADPYDDRGADDLGCLASAASHLQQTPGEKKYLVIASPLVNNVWLQKTDKLNFAGATVEVVFRTCEIASACQASAAAWASFFRRFGARSVSFKDPAESEVFSALPF